MKENNVLKELSINLGLNGNDLNIINIIII